MAKGIIGIDVADFSIEAVILDKERKGYKVQAYSRINLIPEIVEDGRILDKEKFKSALKQLFSNAQPKPIQKPEDYKVFLSIPESKVFSKVLEIPNNIKEKEIKEVARRRAEELIPEDFDSLLTDMKIIGDRGDNKEIFFVAAEKSVVNEFVDVFDFMKMEIEGITSESISSFAGLSESLEKKTTLLLDIGSRTTIASIFDESGIRDSININIAGNNIDNALAEKMGIPHSVANERKQTIGLDASANDGEIMLIIQGQLQPLADELKRFISYFENTYNKKIEQIILIGGLAQMKGIDNYFGGNLNIPAMVGYSFIDANFLPKPIANTKFINAFGLARLGHNHPEINFYEKFSREKKEEIKEEKPIAKQQDSNSDEELVEDEIEELKKNKLHINPLYIIILCIVFLGVVGFVFREKIFEVVPFLNKNKPTVETEQIMVKDNYSFNREILVAKINETGAENFVQAEEYILDNVVETNGIAYEYQEIVKDIYDLFDTKTLLDLGEDSRQESGYYILPNTVDLNILNISPSEEDYNLGDPLSIKSQYIFFKINEKTVENYVYSVIPKGEIGDLSNWDRSIDYQVIKYDSETKSFNIMVSLKLQKK